MIFLVDDEPMKMRPYKTELEIASFRVEVYDNANEALEILSTVNISDVELVIIDIMLGVRYNNSDTAFSDSATRQHMRTGLVLLDRLVKANNAVFPRKAVLLTGTTDEDITDEAKRKAAGYKIELLYKDNFRDANEFCKKIKEMLPAGN